MLGDKKDDIFLSRWINGELSEQELEEFRTHPEYDHYVKIMTGADALDLRDYDIEKELQSLKSKKSSQAPKKIGKTIKLWPVIGIAASIAIIIGVFLYNPNSSFVTEYGETLSVQLPDGSEMILNAKSKASFNQENWKNTRLVSLEGEAFFKVKKGSKFTVETTNGEVSVLGTQFNVQSQNSFFEVNCYEGKVSVVNRANTAILTAGKAYRNIGSSAEKWTFTGEQPTWLTYTSSFKSIPIEYVFKELEKQYNIQIKTSNTDLKTIYTGTFPNNDLEVALRTVFSTLGMDYNLSKDRKTVVLEK
ncbi:FecR family protein [Aquimarina sp. D1M17]|uniref:FecR family protein n=1 Tax=Aquimarina acroporae TaxID=2937283 RepID=UPI0020C04B05|nr:FecR family protein [Aquimarina acroporae]MCK8522783.1 FecR family protein [Aquimarina acroporae]